MLEARSITKRFNRRVAVDRVSFVARAGEITGCLGPNGAGKSTTVKLLTGLLEPSSGHVLVEGADVRRDPTAFKRRLGYVPEEPHLYPHLSGREYLQLVGRLRGLQEKPLAKRIDALLDLLALGPQRYAALGAYSKGMRQKVLIAAALLHNPDILVLDEPLSGLDVTTALVLRSLITALGREGKTILLSSHVLELVERVCARVVILHRGRVVADDSVERLRQLMNLPSLEEVFAELAVEQDPERIASDIVSVMKDGA